MASGIRSRPFRRAVEFDGPDTSASIGVVVPFDFSLDWEYWSYLPAGVSLHFTRTPHRAGEVGAALARSESRPGTVAKATRSLSSVSPAAVLYACSSGSFIGGVEGEAAIRRAMLDAGAPAAITTASATVDALRLTGMRRVSVVTPYSARLTAKFADFIEDSGFEVASAHHLGVTRNISRISQATIKDLVREADDVDADAVVVSCTALRTWGIVNQLEGELGRPVFTSNQVSLWAVLHAAGVLRDAMARRDGWAMGGSDPARSTRMLVEMESVAGAA
jgi:maleate isomerase